MKKIIILLLTTVLLGLTACTSISKTTPSPTATVEDNIKKATRIAAEAVQKSELYSEKGLVGGMVPNLEAAKSIDIKQRRNEMCYEVVFSDETGNCMLCAVYLNSTSFEVIGVEQMK